MLAAQKPGDALWPSHWIPAEGENTIAKRSQSSSSTLLYCSWFCPFAQRAWIAMEEKDIDYKYVEVNPYEVDPKEEGGYTKKQLPINEKKRLFPDFLAVNPNGLVPALDNGGEKLYESLQVVEYIDDKFKDRGPRLMPDDPLERARVRIWAEMATSKVQREYYKMLMAQDSEEQETAKKAFFERCREFARAMDPIEGSNGAFFLGSRFTLVDIALAPYWQRFLLVGGFYRGLKLPQDEPEFRRLEAWWKAVQARPGFARTRVCDERLIASYSQYSRNLGTSEYAKNLQSALSAKSRAAQGLARKSSAGYAAMAVSFGIGALAGAGIAAALARR
eukprot:CAMPEP_0184297666 /NCGR_PEP_ID=MMETSP1049-20130417/8561_1 /TAXON_ID=77928 /ORGANISM="Proteomonas sulcata, Strain CCMP704" /LENGTH=332 /DNA_ID=CAMNT_0026607499 /DNA_START=357 /DNA_END=1355 /DNA_ORIENTATION=+